MPATKNSTETTSRVTRLGATRRPTKHREEWGSEIPFSPEGIPQHTLVRAVPVREKRTGPRGRNESRGRVIEHSDDGRATARLLRFRRVLRGPWAALPQGIYTLLIEDSDT